MSLLGEQAVTDDRGRSVRTRSSRAVALIAFLVVHAGSPQARQRMAGVFWPESTDAQALTNLRRELYHLRQALGDEPSLVVTSRDLCWRDTKTCRVDVRVFDIERNAALAAAAAGDDDGILRHATAAITAYRGELLPGVYEDWLLEARSQLERQCVDMCDLASTARARTGDLAGAAAAARRRVQLQPLEEVGYRTLMELQADMGDRSGTGLLTEVSLGPLEAADTANLAEAISGQRFPAADADLLYAATGGFPLYVIEAVRDTGATSLPAGDLAAVLRKRLEQGTAAVREVADLAAAVGTNFTLDLLTEASDLDADVVVEAVDEPESELCGQAHFVVGGSAVSLGMPAEGLSHLELAAKLTSSAVRLSVGTRPDVHGIAWAAHAHWLLGQDDDALDACCEATRLARAIDHPYSQLWPSPMLPSPIRCATPWPSSPTPSKPCAGCATGMSSPTTASGC